MNDSQFIKEISRCKTAFEFLEFIKKYPDKELNDNQCIIFEAMYSIAAIGDDGNFFKGLERLKKTFSSNFQNNLKFGTKTRGSFRNIEKIRERERKYAKVAELIAFGISQTKACEDEGVKPRQYRAFRDKVYKSYIERIEPADRHKAVNPDRWLFISTAIFMMPTELITNKKAKEAVENFTLNLG